ncbi:MAG: endolytic transglycosylase MltG [Nitrospira sp.]|nr:endolytic transglycosylase MltG [Nitrospira sp.]MDH4243438.1 endolytic transglycosylase MltG [Nitrospira sp.]MDH4355627.1 endolytic transglycosylase MltG [Nitrospira sp.]MDH5316859.1 endolytic transglycosylase MltG [Nitrospira sp.]
MTLRVLLTGIIAVAALAATVGYQMMRWAEGPVLSESDHAVNKIVVIAEGATFLQVAALLEREELIRSRSAFVRLGKSQEADRKIQPGEYELNGAMPPADILSKLLTGRVLLHTVTIPEGYTVNQIADALEERQITNRAELLSLASDKAFITTLGIAAETVEGYLFPDTYRFAKGTPAKDVMRTMVEQLERVMTEEWQARAKDMNLTVHQVLTLASVIEKETGSGDERPHISSVFHNRLKKRIPLQSDPTVIYGLPNFDGNLRKKDLSHASPYNTYRWAGLPPGPIASPGAESIRAALYPAMSKYLYFVSRNDGTHHFSATLMEHNRAVEKYQKRPFRRGPRSQTSVRPTTHDLAFVKGVS